LRMANAQDISGDWQGNLAEGSQPHRIVLHIIKGKNDEWKGTFYSLDRDPAPVRVILWLYRMECWPLL
jgi:hypothetical protein